MWPTLSSLPKTLWCWDKMKLRENCSPWSTTSMTILISNPLCSFHYCGWPLPDMTFYLGSLFPSNFHFWILWERKIHVKVWGTVLCKYGGGYDIYFLCLKAYGQRSSCVDFYLKHTAFLTLGQTMFGKTGSSLQSTLGSMISLYIPASTMFQICKQISRFKGISLLSHCHLMVLLWLSSFLPFSLFVLFLWKVGKDRIENLISDSYQRAKPLRIRQRTTKSLYWLIVVVTYYENVLPGLVIYWDPCSTL